MQIFYPGTQPKGKMPNGKPWPVLRMDQLTAIYRIKHEVEDADRSGSVLVGAGMGSGKTVVSVEVLKKVMPKRALIVGVRDAYSQWRDQAKDQGCTVPIRRINKTQAGLDNLTMLLDGEDGWYYIGLEMLRAQDWEKVSETKPTDPAIKAYFGSAIEDTITVTEMKQKFTYKNMKPVDILISDESHKHSNQKSIAISTLRTIRAKTKVALSGTFYGNKFENAWSLTTWLWGKSVIGTKAKFELDYCIKVPVMTADGRKQLTTKYGHPISKIMGERNTGEFVDSLPCYVFIATPIGDVPKPEVVKSKLGPEQQRQYDEMEKQSLTWIPSLPGGRAPLIADLPLVQRIRLRTAALGAMTLVPSLDPNEPDTVTFTPGSLSSTLNDAYAVLHRPSWVGKKALILTHSKAFAEETARRIGQKYSVALKTGDTRDWDEMKARFMAPVSETGSIQYVVAVISAIGTATDGLQANCAKVLWLSEDENNVNNIQGSNRVWREGVDLAEYEAVKIVQEGTIAEGVLQKNDAHRVGVMRSVEGSR